MNIIKWEYSLASLTVWDCGIFIPSRDPPPSLRQEDESHFSPDFTCSTSSISTVAWVGVDEAVKKVQVSVLLFLLILLLLLSPNLSTHLSLGYHHAE